VVAERRREGKGARYYAKRAAAGFVAVSAAAFVLIGFLHAKSGRPLLMHLAALGGCPVAAKVTPEQIETARRASVAQDRGTTLAPSRPALGFVLDRTTIADARAWAAKNGVRCVEKRPGLLRCAEVPSPALGRPELEGTVEDLALGFAPSGRLVNVTTLRRGLQPSDASRVSENIAASLRSELGPPTHVEGNLDPAYLGGSTLATATLQYRYRDYLADVATANLSASGVVIREQYITALD
jgi:hypothetical protein